MVGFDKAIYLFLLLKSISSVKLTNGLWGSDVLLLLEFTNIVYIFVLYLYWIQYIVIYLLVISFARCKKYLIFLITLGKFLNVVPVFSCPRAIGYLWNRFLGVNILRLEWFETLSEKSVPSVSVGNILFSKASRTLSLPSQNPCKFLRVSLFFHSFLNYAAALVF